MSTKLSELIARLLCLDASSGKALPVFISSKIIVSPFKLQ